MHIQIFMRKIIFTLAAFIFLLNSYAQKSAFSVSLNSGLFSFSGKSTAEISQINYDDQTNSGGTNNPYGAMNGLCYGFSVNFKRIFKKNFIFDVNVGYENLRSKVLIDLINGYTGSSSYQYSATGKTFLNNKFLNLNPAIGYRINAKKILFDITGGVEVGYCIKAIEKGNATANRISYKTSVNRRAIKTDIKPGIQLSIHYNKAGIYLGYAYGLVNYASGFRGGTNDCYARLIRFGFAYQIL